MRALFFTFLLLAANGDYKSVRGNSIANNDPIMYILRKSFEKKDCKTFLLNFPSSFREFIRLYDYNDSRSEVNLYKYYESHINYLFECGSLNSYFVDKLVSVSVNGEWSADAVSLFQTKEIELLLKKPDSFLYTLRNKSKREQKLFWHFIFDGSPPHDKQIRVVYARLYKTFAGKDPSQAKNIKEEFYKMYH